MAFTSKTKTSEWNHGAGKGPEQRPLDIKKFKKNLASIDFTHVPAGLSPLVKKVEKLRKDGRTRITYK